MGYQYTEQRENLFTERGHETFLTIRDNAGRMLRETGAFRADRAWRRVSGDTWLMIAALDYLVERGELVEWSPPNGGTPMAQYRVFVAGSKWSDGA